MEKTSLIQYVTDVQNTAVTIENLAELLSLGAQNDFFTMEQRLALTDAIAHLAKYLNLEAVEI